MKKLTVNDKRLVLVFIGLLIVTGILPLLWGLSGNSEYSLFNIIMGSFNIIGYSIFIIIEFARIKKDL